MNPFAALPAVVSERVSSKSTVGTVNDIPVKDPKEGPYRVFPIGILAQNQTLMQVIYSWSKVPTEVFRGALRHY